MTLQQIQYFREIAKTHTFTQAAQNLYVAQSALSYAIQSLEKEIGVPLFVRKSGRQVFLTSYGQAFLPYAEKILAELELGRQTIDIMKNPNSGVVTVAYSYSNCFSLVSMVFQKFYEEHSYSDISVRFEVNQEKKLIEQQVAAGKQDLAFSCTPSFEGTCSLPIAQQELFLLVPSSHRLASARCVSLQDVKDELFVGYYRNWNLSNWVSQMFASEGLNPNILEYFSDWATQMNYVAMGVGLAISPRIPSAHDEYIKAIPIDHPNRFRNIYLHWADNRKLSVSAKYVRDYCVSFFQERNLIF